MPSRLRILTVMPFFSWRFGGSVELTRLLCSELARRGHDVRVLTTDLGERDSVTDAWTRDDGFHVFRAHAGWFHAAPPYLPPRALLTALEAELPRASLVTSQVGLTLLATAVGARCRRAGVPFVYGAQGALDPMRLRLKRWRKACFLRACERPLLRQTAAVHALTAKEADDLQRHGAPRNRIFVVPNGIEPEAWCSGDGAAIRARWGIPADAVVVLFLGRLAPEKGLPLALAAALPLLRERAWVWFVAAGPDGGAARELRRLAERAGVGRHVVLPGPVPPQQRRDVLAAADVFAYPSLGEGLPLAVLEAAAAGLALWITDRCNLPEVTEFTAGAVVSPEVRLLRAALWRLIDDVDVRRHCAVNARRMVQTRFALTRVVDQLETVYDGLRA